ncbi:DNA oxidative demethylase [Candidatus Nitrotoga sp. BS]|uniref:DNA oxidative demethylase AlkB n=1 Tax=Candidatus Nitrotoga sp. BS TaxID=2890408 RepID=UPI001EF28C29|nr:DNA oxidative demethylase AlkB [Candidatus Nitrotoga sp. BS]CAH1207602.1 DNA oxidative demethylase [Candidatus Nitrotoga sp. BS]
MNADLFDGLPDLNLKQVCLDDGAFLLRGFAKNVDADLMCALEKVVTQSPLRHMITPGGFRMSVAMSNCGQVGWITDRRGYRYDAFDPETGRPWPALPEIFIDIARRAAMCAGYENFLPDACLINCYEPGARLSLHQDKNERDESAPIVSVSLGLPAVFLFGGLSRTIRPKRYQLVHGDVAVWGGPARFNFHGIAPLLDGYHPILGRKRINLTFRKAL